MSRSAQLATGLLTSLLLLFGCSSDSTNPDNGASQSGAGASGGGGGASGGSGGQGAGGDGAGGQGVGGGGGCTPGQQLSCYSGPAGSENIGSCVAGTAICAADGTLGACEGEVLPSFDACDTPADEDCSGSAQGCSGNVVFARMMSGNVYDHAAGVAFMSNGDLVAVGYTTSWNFQGYPGGTLHDADTPSSNEHEIFVVRTTSDGVGVFSQLYGGLGDQLPRDVVVDSNDNIYIAGFSENAVDFGDGASNGPSLFLLKLDPLGTLVWSKHFDYPGAAPELSLAMDGDDKLLMLSGFDGSSMDLDLGGGPLPKDNATNFLAKFDADGQLVFAHSIISGGFGVVSLAAALDGRVFVSGRYQGTFALDGVSHPAATPNFLMAVITPDASLSFVHTLPSYDHPRVYMAAAPGGDVWVAGRGIDGFPADTTFPPTGVTDEETFLARYDAAGNFIAAVTYPNLQVRHMAADGAGYPILGGTIDAGGDLGNGPYNPAFGDDGVFMAKWDLQQNVLWARTGDKAANFAGGSTRRVAVGPSGRSAMTGTFGGTFDFGQGPFAGNTGNQDALIAVFEP